MSILTQLPKRKSNAHKGDFGKVLIVAGSVGFAGAAVLCGRAAVRSGAGLTYMAVPPELYTVAVLGCPEVMAFHRDFDSVMEKLSKCTVCAVGPGLGSENDELVCEIIRNSKIPLIIDADGINAVSRHINVLSERECELVFTPHEGEFARLAPDIEGPRHERASALAAKFGCTVVLKGEHSITAFADGERVVNLTGNPGMAKGGSGDVLTGLIAAFVGQFGIGSVPLAVMLHGLAGDIACMRFGEYSMTASDIVDVLPTAISRFILPTTTKCSSID